MGYELTCRLSRRSESSPVDNRIKLTNLPTAVHPLPRVGRAQGIDRLWVKRDDQSGLLYGTLPAAGEILVSEAAYAAAGLNPGEREMRQLEVKGREKPIGVYVL